MIAGLEAVAAAHRTLPAHTDRGLPIPLLRILRWRLCARQLVARLLRSRTHPVWADADLRDPVCAHAAAVLAEFDDADPPVGLATSRER